MLSPSTQTPCNLKSSSSFTRQAWAPDSIRPTSCKPRYSACRAEVISAACSKLNPRLIRVRKASSIGFHLCERLAIAGEARHVGPGLDDIVAPGDRTAAQAGELVAVETIIRLGMRHAHVAKADDEDAKFFGHDRSFDGLVNR